jgi:hypothetical protein
MPRPKPTELRRPATGPAEAEGSVRFSTVNWILLTAALMVIGLGFVTLSRGSTVAAPLLLVLGYAVLIPLGIIR